MAKKETTALLRSEVQKRLCPEFFKDGFKHHELPSDEKGLFKHVFPFGYFKRKRDDGLDIVEVQFDQNRLPRFVINFGTAPKEGVVLPWGVHRSQEEAEVSALNGFRLYNSSRRLLWFKVGSFNFGSDEVIVAKLITSAVCKKPEIDRWFDDGTVGKHMRPFGVLAEQ